MDEKLQCPADECSPATDPESLVDRAIHISDFRHDQFVSDEELVAFLRTDIHTGSRKHVDRLYPVLLRRCSMRVGRYLAPYPNLDRDTIEAEVLGKVIDLLLDKEVATFPVARFGLWFKRKFIDARRRAEQEFKANRKELQDSRALEEDLALEVTDSSLDAATIVKQLCDQLSDDEWELLMMYYHHSLKRKEITEILGCSSKTTYNRLKKLKARVNDILQGEEYAD